MDAIYLEEYNRRMQDKGLHPNSHTEPDWQEVLLHYTTRVYEVSDSYDPITGTDRITAAAPPDVVSHFSWLEWLGFRIEALNMLFFRLLTFLFWFLINALWYTVYYGFHYIILPSAAIFFLLNLLALLRLHRVWLWNQAPKPFHALLALPALLGDFASRKYAFYRYTDREIQIWDGTRSRPYIFNPCDEMRLWFRQATAYLWSRVRYTVYLALLAAVVLPLLRVTPTASPRRPEVQFVSMTEAASMGWDVPLWVQLAEHTAFQGDRTHFPKAVTASQWERPTTAERERMVPGASATVPMGPSAVLSVEGKTFCARCQQAHCCEVPF